MTDRPFGPDVAGIASSGDRRGHKEFRQGEHE
jgi:hypothetical protein